jgi:Zn-dependent protease with chaperone function
MGEMSGLPSTPRIPGVMKPHASFLLSASIALATALSIGTARADDDVHVYRLHDVATQSDDVELRAEAEGLEAIYADLERVSGVEATLLYSTSPDINAFATYAGDEKVVVVEAGFVEYAKQDRDAVAAALGHELGHHKADHIRGGQRKRQGIRVLGAILGAVVGAKVGVGGGIVSDAVDAGAGLVALKFNRNQELEADRLSVDWLIQAGYNPQGMLRLQQKLAELEKAHPQSAILSTHPTSAKRYAAAEKRIAKRAPPAELLAKRPAPLVDDTALASANEAIRHDADARLAEALKPNDAPAAALLESRQGMKLADYAALSMELEWAGEKGRAAVLKRHQLTAAQWTETSEVFGTRIRSDPSVADYFKVHYFRAAQGRFAAYGRDLADSYEKGQALELAPPLPIDEFRALATAPAASSRSGIELAEGSKTIDGSKAGAPYDRTLRQHGLSRQDFEIVDAWWLRRIEIAVLEGDRSITDAFTDADGNAIAPHDAADAEASGVVIGDNVRIGPSVRIGGKPAAKTAENP